MGTSRDLLDVAAMLVGVKEGSPGHREILDIYSSLPVLPRGHKPTVEDDWCAIFVSAVAVGASCTDIIPCECSCTLMRNKAKDMGIWKDYTRSFVPPSGAVIMWDWDATKKNGPDHVGFVVEADNSQITVIDGNWSNMVCLRNVDYTKIHGYILPKYNDLVEKSNQFIICPHCGEKIYFKGE